MKNITLKIILATFFLTITSLKAQIGIGTTVPYAQLDVRSSSQTTPANTDGILIPKVDTFPASNPGVDQQSMLVYLTAATTFGGNPKPIGFYYWDNGTADWIGISSAANGDHDWYEVGSTTAPNAITDDMFHTGNVAIGKNTANFPLEVNTTAFDTGINNLQANNSNNLLKAIENTINGTGTGSHYGVFNSITGTGDGSQYGDYTNIDNTGNGTHYGSYNLLNGSGTGARLGFSTYLTGASTGTQYGTDVTIDSPSNFNHYGSAIRMGGTGSGVRYANYSIISGTGTGAQVAFYTNNTNSGNGIHYGAQYNLAGTGSGDHFGLSNSLTGNSSGIQNGIYNDITNTGNGNHYGTRNSLSGTGTGIKYGTYNQLNTAAGGTHYGVYSEVLKAGATNFAGYFLGNVGIGTTAANTYTFPASRGTNGQVMQTNGTGVVSWASPNTFAWDLGGNSAVAANFIGTTNPIAFRMFSNNIERMRINPTDGEVVVGAAASPYAGDALSAVATPALTFGVNGYSAQNGSGTWGEILAGSSTGFSAVQGYYGGSGVGAGVFGNYNGTNTSNTRAGVYGVCSTPAATNGGAGVVGYNAIASGNQHMGVLGYYNGSSYGIGVNGIGFGGGIMTGNNDVAVVGWRANNANYSGYFNGNHVIANGTKTASVGTSKGNQLLYVTELPEVWFEDVGGGQLVNGITHVELDPMFLETIFIDDKHPMRVFLQEEGECNGLIVIKDVNNKGFTVKEKNGGTSDISFSFRIMAKRLHFQDHRFGNDPLWGEGDTRKYNQYATPPPVDYQQNVRFQEEQKRNFKPTPMPEGFINYFQLKEEAKKMETKKTPNKETE